MIYRLLIKPILFKIDPERIHNVTLKVGNVLGCCWLSRNLIKLFFNYENSILASNVMGINFKNPIGLGAGLDKNGVLTDIIPEVGFGFMEVGSVTAEKCSGNSKPRLWRLPKDNSLAINLGLCNDGAKEISAKLLNKRIRIPVGVNVARTNKAMNGKESIKDYVNGLKTMQDIGDYITINLSCPNMTDKKNFCDAVRSDRLLKEVGKLGIKKPILLKIKPDLDDSELYRLLAVVKKHKFVCGFVISNLASDRGKLKLKTKKELLDKASGGISGWPIKELSTECIRKVYKKTKGKYVIIGCGGVFTAEDAYEKIKAGASLIQIVTGLIYNGPCVVKCINRGLVRLLERDGFKSIQEAVGSGNK